MTHDNALRTPQTLDAMRTRIHLVHSRAWQSDRRANRMERFRLAPQVTQPVHKSHKPSTRDRAAAALTAPFLWIGHTMRHLMHVVRPLKS
jgi:hypothetical protein